MAGLLAIRLVRGHVRAGMPGMPPQAGVSLIEFLVVLVIITVGLLSVAGMLAFGIKQDQETVFRAMAATQAKALAESMHANLAGANAGFYKSGQTVTIPPPPCATGTSSDRCLAALRAAVADRTRWETATANALPVPADKPPIVSFDTATKRYTIRITWSENVRAVGGTTATPTTPYLEFTYQAIPEVEVR